MARLFRFALAAILTVAVSLFVTYGSYVLGLWASGHRFRLERCLQLGVLLPIFVGLLAALWPLRKSNWDARAAGMAGAAVGLTYGYLAVRVDRWIILRSFRSLGHFAFLKIVWSMDIEMMVCGAMAGACAMLLTTTSRTRNVLLTVALLVMVGILIPGPVFDLVTRNQELTVAVVIPQSDRPPSPEVEVADVAQVRPVDASAVSSRVVQLLRNAGIDGNYQVAQLYRQGHGKQVLAIIVIGGHITAAADLPEPHGTDVIYVQEPDGWKRIPSQVPTLDRHIHILQDPDGKSCHGIDFTDASGVGTAVFWEVPRNAARLNGCPTSAKMGRSGTPTLSVSVAEVAPSFSRTHFAKRVGTADPFSKGFFGIDLRTYEG